MAIPLVAVTIRLTTQDGSPMVNAPCIARLTSTVVYQGYLMPETTQAATDSTGTCVMHLWPNVLGTTYSEYKFSISNIETGHMTTVYVSLPNEDVNLWDLTTADSGSPNSNGSVVLQSATVTVGTTTTGAPGTAAQAINRGSAQNRIVDFVIPRGQDGAPGINGLNGTGTITIKETITGAPGTPASVVNVGTDARAELVLTIPQGIPGNSNGSGVTGGGLPLGGSDKQVLVKVGSTDGAATWQTLAPIVDTLMGTYLWESTVVTPPTNPGSNVLDATTLTAYLAAIADATLGNKRVAGANAIIVAMGTAQKLTLKRNGIAVLVADYTGAMTQTNNGTNIGVALSGTFTVGAIAAADVSSGTWTGEITGGASYARKITLPISTDVSTAPGQGFNPTVNLIIPRSVDGL